MRKPPKLQRMLMAFWKNTEKSDRLEINQEHHGKLTRFTSSKLVYYFIFLLGVGHLTENLVNILTIHLLKVKLRSTILTPQLGERVIKQAVEVQLRLPLILTTSLYLLRKK